MASNLFTYEFFKDFPSTNLGVLFWDAQKGAPQVILTLNALNGSKISVDFLEKGNHKFQLQVFFPLYLIRKNLPCFWKTWRWMIFIIFKSLGLDNKKWRYVCICMHIYEYHIFSLGVWFHFSMFACFFGISPQRISFHKRFSWTHHSYPWNSWNQLMNPCKIVGQTILICRKFEEIWVARWVLHKWNHSFIISTPQKKVVKFFLIYIIIIL